MDLLAAYFFPPSYHVSKTGRFFIGPASFFHTLPFAILLSALPSAALAIDSQNSLSLNSRWRTERDQAGILKTVTSLDLASSLGNFQLKAFLGDRRPGLIPPKIFNPSPADTTAGTPILSGAVEATLGQAASVLAIGTLRHKGLLARLRAPLESAPPKADGYASTAWEANPTAASDNTVALHGLFAFEPNASLHCGCGLTLSADLSAAALISVQAKKKREEESALELLIQARHRDADKDASWFAKTPLLPEREEWLGALALKLKNGTGQLAGDAALSFSHYGQIGLYGGLAGQLGPASRRLGASFGLIQGHYVDPTGELMERARRFRLNGAISLNARHSLTADINANFTPSISEWRLLAGWNYVGEPAADCRLTWLLRLGDKNPSQEAQAALKTAFGALTLESTTHIDISVPALSLSRLAVTFKHQDITFGAKAERSLSKTKSRWAFSLSSDWETRRIKLGAGLAYAFTEGDGNAVWSLQWVISLRDTGKLTLSGVQ